MKPQFSTKKDLRERIISLLRKQEEKERLSKSALIAEKFEQSAEFKKAKTVLFYASFDGEVETLQMIKKAWSLGKRVGLPVVDKAKKKIIPVLVTILESLEDGLWGIKQPKMDASSILALDELDLVVVPAVAFDSTNNRLGRGQGYYDRFLKQIPKDTPTLGLAFDFQIVDCIPSLEAHDVGVSRVITN